MRPAPITLEEIAGMAGVNVLIPAQVAYVLNCDPFYINLMCRTPEKREKLGFPTVCIGRNVKIPRLAFLKFMGYDGPIAK
ncbi:MAG: hypothetical protein IJ392_04065 [Clostridia bacterium]|nr:hypothetical protein [Clostridia bacterium]